MKRTQILMDMPITVEIVDRAADPATLDMIYDYFTYVDETFSTFKESSEIGLINRGGVKRKAYSKDMGAVLSLCQETKEITGGYFDIGPSGHWDPSGLVKGWAINNAAQRLLSLGYKDFYVEAGGDIQAFGHNADHEKWRVGIRNPFAMTEIVKVLMIEDQGVATSGTYIRGQHIRDPHSPDSPLTEVVSLTVVGDNVFDADLAGRPLGWLSSFLAPMQDGNFREGGTPHPVGPAVFVFAGGTCATLAEFVTAGDEADGRRAKKPDFVSCLRGYLNIFGPNRTDQADVAYPLRRAFLLRSLLMRKAPQTVRAGRLSIDDGVLRAFLQTERFIHGARSVEAIIDQSPLTGKARFARSSLPPADQLSLHVDAEEFLALVRG